MMRPAYRKTKDNLIQNKLIVSAHFWFNINKDSTINATKF